MDKKVPKVFVNKVEHEFKNNENVYYSFNEKNIRGKNNLTANGSIMQKLKMIFNSPKFVYKAKVDIVTIEGIVTKEIVGYNKTHIMTMNNEAIPISKIEDIYFSK